MKAFNPTIAADYVTAETFELLKSINFPMEELPLKSQVIRWMREHYRLSVESAVGASQKWEYRVVNYNRRGDPTYVNRRFCDRYTSYEDACEQGIREACRYISNMTAEDIKKGKRA